MIRILVPYSSMHYVKDVYVSKLNYFGSHYELTLYVNGRSIPIVFGRRKQGCFVYFPAFEEGINISLHQWPQETIDKISFLFDQGTSTAITTVVNQFLSLEGGQKWYGNMPRKPGQVQSRQERLPF